MAWTIKFVEPASAQAEPLRRPTSKATSAGSRCAAASTSATAVAWSKTTGGRPSAAAQLTCVRRGGHRVKCNGSMKPAGPAHRQVPKGHSARAAEEERVGRARAQGPGGVVRGRVGRVQNQVGRRPAARGLDAHVFKGDARADGVHAEHLRRRNNGTF